MSELAPLIAAKIMLASAKSQADQRSQTPRPEGQKDSVFVPCFRSKPTGARDLQSDGGENACKPGSALRLWVSYILRVIAVWLGGKRGRGRGRGEEEEEEEREGGGGFM